ncbi:MAG: glucose-6-phosphate isomerase [Nitrospirales bacterium]
MSRNHNLGQFQAPVDAALADMAQRRLLERMWKKDYRVWKPTQVEITNRLGWLTVAEQMQERVGVLKHFAQSVRDAGFRYVVVLGMGGSSLGPEVLRQTFGASRGFLKPFVLDSTVPGAVRDVHDSIDPVRTLFIVSSKSGGTIEVMSLFAYFWDVVARARGGSGGNQFISITDPDTSLGTLAHDRGFRTTFLNPPDIGGRYSVLSYFGLVPAALMGVNVERLLERAVDMTRLCGPTVATQQNPAAFLGAVMGVLGQAGHDKVTLIASPKIQSFGLWAEQLLAESTGKEGNGLIPVAQEPMVPPSAYGQDRLFIALRLDGDANKNIDRHVAALKRAGYPVVQLRLRDRFDLGAEFFRWEFATAIAGHALRIHPFDQPNVQESKDNTKRILEQFQREGHLPDIKSTVHWKNCARRSSGRLPRRLGLSTAVSEDRCGAEGISKTYGHALSHCHHGGVWAAIPAFDRTITQGWAKRRRVSRIDGATLTRCQDSRCSVYLRHSGASPGGGRRAVATGARASCRSPGFGQAAGS